MLVYLFDLATVINPRECFFFRFAAVHERRRLVIYTSRLKTLIILSGKFFFGDGWQP